MGLLAICDTTFYFTTMVDFGAYCWDIDAAIFNESAFGKAFGRNDFHLPELSESNPGGTLTTSSNWR